MKAIVFAAFIAQPGCMSQDEYVDAMNRAWPGLIAPSTEELTGVTSIDTWHPHLGYNLMAEFKGDCLVEMKVIKPEDDQK